jgi:hypothetical protein
VDLQPLTTKEIAELRASLAAAQKADEHLCPDALMEPVARLLAEVEHRRTVQRIVGHCSHGKEHAPYCAGCCAQFDPGRMVLIHESTCRFRGHERAAT